MLSARPLARGAGWRVVDLLCRAGPGDRPYPERHPWVSVAAVLSGTFSYHGARGRALMTPGSLLLGARGTCFECGHEHATGDRCVAFHFAPAFTQDVLSGIAGAREDGFRLPRIAPSETLLPLLARVRGLAARPDPLRAEALALALATAAFAADQDGALARATIRDEARAAQAVALIDADYPRPLSIAGLARSVGLGRRRFATAFRQAVGVTPYGYILRRRLDAAAAQLEAGAPSVLQVCLEVGFSDLSEFTRRFRDRFGQPPAAYRRAARRTP